MAHCSLPPLRAALGSDSLFAIRGGMGTVNWGKAQGDVAKPEPAQGLLAARGHSLQGYQPAVGQQGLSQGRGTLLLDHVVLQAARRGANCN